MSTVTRMSGAEAQAHGLTVESSGPKEDQRRGVGGYTWELIVDFEHKNSNIHINLAINWSR